MVSCSDLKLFSLQILKMHSYFSQWLLFAAINIFFLMKIFITIYLIISNLAQEIRLLISILGSFSLLAPFIWDGIFDSWFATYIFFARSWRCTITWTCVKRRILWVPHVVKGQHAYCWSTSVIDGEIKFVTSIRNSSSTYLNLKYPTPLLNQDFFKTKYRNKSLHVTMHLEANYLLCIISIRTPGNIILIILGMIFKGGLDEAINSCRSQTISIDKFVSC